MSSEQIYKTNQKIWRWERDSHIAGLAGGLVLVCGGVLTAGNPVVLAVGLSVMVTARIGGEWIVESLKKNVIAQQKNMVEPIADPSSVDLMIEAEKSQSIRPTVRTAMSSAYIGVGGLVALAPVLTSNANDGVSVGSIVVGALVGFTAGRIIETLARKKVRFYDNAPGVATAVMDAVLKDKVLEQRSKNNDVVPAPRSKM